MIMDSYDRKTYQEEQLARWGLLKEVQREETIDKLISDLNPPNIDQKEHIVSNWLIRNGIESDEQLKTWQQSHE